MLPPEGQNNEHHGVQPETAQWGIFGWALFIVRLLLWLLLVVAIAPLATLWKVLGWKRIWPQIFFRGLCATMGLRVHIHGKPSGNALYLPNHISWMDILALLSTTGSAFVAHDGLTASRVFKWLADLNDTVFIARHQRSSIGMQVANIRQAVAGHGALTIFIEGTTSDGTDLLPFKSALLSALEPLPEDLTVQPVWLRYADGPTVSWIDDESGIANVRRMLSRFRPIAVDLYFLDPLTGDALKNRKTMAAAARAAIAARMALG